MNISVVSDRCQSHVGFSGCGDSTGAWKRCPASAACTERSYCSQRSYRHHLDSTCCNYQTVVAQAAVDGLRAAATGWSWTGNLDRRHSCRALTASNTVRAARMMTTSHSSDPLPLSVAIPNTASIQSRQRIITTVMVPVADPGAVLVQVKGVVAFVPVVDEGSIAVQNGRTSSATTPARTSDNLMCSPRTVACQWHERREHRVRHSGRGSAKDWAIR